jgi:anti-sigma-K factor RskA
VGGFLVGHQGGAASDVQAAAAFVSDPATRVAHLSGTGTGNLSIAYQPGRRSAYLIGSGVPAAPSDKVYELWRFGPSGSPVPSGTFEASGKIVVLRVAADLSKDKQVAITVERAPGAKQPTTSPIFTAPISV